MYRKGFLTTVLAGVGLSAFAAADVTKVFTTAEIDAVVGTVDIEMLTVDSSGRLYFSNATDTSDADGFAIVSGMPGGSLSVIATGADVLAAVDAANGATAAPATLTLRGMGVDSIGSVILAFDPSSSSDSWLVRVRPFLSLPGYAVEVIGGAASPNYVDGTNSLAVVGSTAYLVRNGFFADAANTAEDSVATFSTSGTGNNASQAGTLLVNEATLTAASGFNVASNGLAMNGAAATAGGDVLLLDSGAGGSSDSVGKITSAGAFSIAKAATALESELGYSDIGVAAVTADTATGDIYLWMGDFTTGGPATDGNVIIRVAGGTGTATRVITEDEIHADADYGTTGLFTNSQGLAFHNETLYWTDDNTEALYSVSTTLPSAVSEWSLYQ